MQNLETEKSQMDYSKMTISQLETSLDKLREDIKKIGSENIMILSVFIFLKKDKKHSFRMRLPGDWAEGFNDSGRLKWERGGAYSFGKRPSPFLNVSKTPAEAGAFPRT